MSDPAPLRSIPPVNAVLAREELAESVATLGHSGAVRAVRAAIDEARDAIRAGRPAAIDAASLATRARAIGESDRPRPRPAINATGVLLNTGLGRAPMAAEAVEAVARVAVGYCDLEIDLESGGRGGRTRGVAEQLRRLTGAEAATVVNNNAAATVLALRALASGREVVVSRGQLVEIGGSFRLPEVFEVAGVRLREVGTTNRTRLDDYDRAIGPDTAALLRVHPSNYRVVGFTESVAIADLAALARRRGLWTIDDVGSGVLRPGLPPGVDDEPTVAEGIAAGADVVLGSGDKLLGGPQCGLMMGKASAIGRIEADPMMRAVRVDKMTIAALGATLRLAARESPGVPAIPLWRLLAEPIESLRDRAGRLADRLVALGFAAESVASEAMLGGGSDPGRSIPSRAVRLAPPYPAPLDRLDESAMARALRTGATPVVARVRGGAVLIDLGAVFPDQDEAIAAVVTGLLGEGRLDGPRGGPLDWTGATWRPRE